MRPWEIALIVAGGTLGYGVVGFLTSAVMAGITSTRRCLSETDKNKGEAASTFLGGILWPLAILGLAVYFLACGLSPGFRRAGSLWWRLVRRLNPNIRSKLS